MNNITLGRYIPYDTIITFGGKNYYAIGTNTLIEIEN